MNILAISREGWFPNVFDLSAASGVDDLTETASAALRFIALFGPSAISLRGLRSEAVQGEHLALLLRTLATWRDQIDGWHEALSVARDAIERAGLDPADAMFGLAAAMKGEQS